MPGDHLTLTTSSVKYKRSQKKQPKPSSLSVVTLISRNRGVHGGRDHASPEKTFVDLIKDARTLKPREHIFLVGGYIARRCYWDMVKDLTVEQVRAILKDLPQETDLETLERNLGNAFATRARELEQQYIAELEGYLKKNAVKLGFASSEFEFTEKKQVIKSHSQSNQESKPIIPIIANWERRYSFQNAKPEDERTRLIYEGQLKEAIEKRADIFIRNKSVGSSELEDGRNKLRAANPLFKDINFVELDKIISKKYQLEECEMCSNIQNTEMQYQGNPPDSMALFFRGQDGRTWCNYSPKQSHDPEEKPIYKASKKKRLLSISTEKLDDEDTAPEKLSPAKRTSSCPNLKALLSGPGQLLFKPSPECSNEARPKVLLNSIESLIQRADPEIQKLALKKMEEALKLLQLQSEPSVRMG